MKAGKTKLTTLVAIGAIVAVGVLLAAPYFAGKKAVQQVECAPYLAKVYRYEGEPANVSIIVKDAIDKDPISGANLYLLEKKPYYWDKLNKYSSISDMISGKTPVGTSDANGKLVFAVSVPYADEGEKTYYAILTANGYWSELYNTKVGFSPVLVAQDQQQCLSLYKKTDITAADLVDVSMTRVYDNAKVKLSDVELQKIGNLKYDSTLSLGVNADETAKKLTATTTIYPSEGYARFDAIEFKRLLDDFKNEGIKRVEVEIKQGETVLYRKVLYDEYDSSSPLAKDDTLTENEINGKDLLVLKPDVGVTIKVTVIADTEATASQGSGRLGPGEQFLQIVLKQAHPQEASPVTITVEG